MITGKIDTLSAMTIRLTGEDVVTMIDIDQATVLDSTEEASGLNSISIIKQDMALKYDNKWVNPLDSLLVKILSIYPSTEGFLNNVKISEDSDQANLHSHNLKMEDPNPFLSQLNRWEKRSLTEFVDLMKSYWNESLVQINENPTFRELPKSNQISLDVSFS